MTLRVKNWDTYQHYRDRKPPWLKLHRSLLDNWDYFSLGDRAARFLPLVWIVASDDDGFLPSLEDFAWRLRIEQAEAVQVLGELAEARFLEEVEDSAHPRCDWASRYIPKAVRIAVFQRDHGRCIECGSRDRIEFDHKIPVSRGGNSVESNVQLLCRSCNRRKHNKLDCAEQNAPRYGANCSPEERRGETENNNNDEQPRVVFPAMTPERQALKDARAVIRRELTSIVGMGNGDLDGGVVLKEESETKSGAFLTLAKTETTDSLSWLQAVGVKLTERRKRMELERDTKPAGELPLDRIKRLEAEREARLAGAKA